MPNAFGMRLAMAAVTPYSLERLQVIKQIGVDHLVYYDMATMPVEYDALAAVVKQAKSAGLTRTTRRCRRSAD